jgi:putative FmdB family regulatory protein
MPIYDYQCNNCKVVFEHYQKINSKPIRKCKSCKEFKLQRLICKPNIIFKGPGFYVNDYKNK